MVFSKARPFLDAHCHLEGKEFSNDIDAVAQRTSSAGVKAIATGRNLEANQKTLGLASQFPDVLYAAIGLSPHDAPSADLENEKRFVEEHVDAAVAVGEVGLDHHYFKKKEDQQKQRQALEAMLEVAQKAGKPVVVHTREAVSEVLEVLQGFNVNAVLHCFLVPSQLSAALDAGCTVSLPTLKNESRETIISEAPLKRLLCETDSPFLWREKGSA